jgi:hypothetical protein
VKIFKNKCNLKFFNLRLQKLHILHNSEKNQTQEGLKVLENVLHVCAKGGAKNSTRAHENTALALFALARASAGERRSSSLVS